MKIRIVLVSMMFLFSSCSFFLVPRSISKNYTLCSNGEETSLDSLIAINGYYSSEIVDTSEGYYDTSVADTLIDSSTRGGHSIVFFSDGKVAYSIYHFDHLKQIIDTNELSEKEFDRYFFNWGNYTVSRDSIIVQYVVIPYFNLNKVWQSYELIFRIKNSNTLTLLFRAPLNLSESSVNNTYEKDKGMENRGIYSDFVFEESDFLPKPNIPKRFRKLYKCE